MTQSFPFRTPVDMGGNKVINGAAGSASGDLVTFGQLGSAAFQAATAFASARIDTSLRAAGTYTLGLTDAGIVLANTAGGNITFNLPAVASGNTGVSYTVKQVGSGGTVTIKAATGDGLEGVTSGTYVLPPVANTFVQLISDGHAGWYVIDQNAPTVQHADMSVNNTTIVSGSGQVDMTGATLSVTVPSVNSVVEIAAQFDVQIQNTAATFAGLAVWNGSNRSQNAAWTIIGRVTLQLLCVVPAGTTPGTYTAKIAATFSGATAGNCTIRSPHTGITVRVSG